MNNEINNDNLNENTENTTNVNQNIPNVYPSYINPFFNTYNLYLDQLKYQQIMEARLDILSKQIDILNKNMESIHEKIKSLNKTDYNKNNNNNNYNNYNNYNKNRYNKPQYPNNQYNKYPNNQYNKYPNSQLNKRKSLINPSLFTNSPFEILKKELEEKQEEDKDEDKNKKSKIFMSNGPLGLLSIIVTESNKKDEERQKEKELVKSEEEEISEYNSEDEFEEIKTDIKTIDDLISLGRMYEEIKEQVEKETELNNTDTENKTKKEEKKKDSTSIIIGNKRYGINLEILNKLIKPLEKLKSMIGLELVKNSIVDMILYYLQSFEKRNKNMLHTVIEGPPGVGKTELGKILAEVYAGLGIINNSDKFKIVKRTDLIGEYLGHTAHKTQKAIDDAEGGVLFIDEAYSLGNDEKRDSYSKECIDTLNLNLSENRNFICIIAGYPDELENSFFSYNPGLKRRFPFKYRIDGYNEEELRDIFIKKIKDSNWKLNEEELNKNKLTDFFKTNKKHFINYGGDIENLIVNCKFMHSRRIVGKHPKFRRLLNKDDIYNGLDKFVSNKKNKQDDDRDKYANIYV